jgi:hypothetical protein
VKIARSLAVAAALVAAASSAQDLGDDSMMRHALSARVIGDGMTMASSGVAPTFSWNPSIAGAGSGPSQLSSSLTINGTTVAPFIEYFGKDAADPTWTASVGPNLTKTARGGTNVAVGAAVAATETTARGAVPAVAGGTGETWQAASAASTTVTTGDLVFEAWFQSSTSGDTIFATYADATANGGYEFQSTGRVILADGTNLALGANSTCPAGSWCHAIAFCDWGSQCTGYINGASPATASIATITTLTAGTPGKLTAGSRSTFSSSFCTGCNIGFFRMWVGPTSWFSSSTQAAVALQRAAQLWGFYPQVAAGAATPLNMTRATTQTCDIDRDGDGVIRYFTLGNNALCLARRKDANSVYAAGYRDESGATNLALQSRTMDDVTWTKVNVTATANAATEPDGTTTAEAMAQVASAGVVAHCFTQAPTLTAATHSLSALFKASTRTWAYINDATIANGAAWINLSTCVAGTQQAGVSRVYTENLGNGWCRLGTNVAGTAAAHTIQLCAASADNTTTYDGGVGTSTQVFVTRAQVEAHTVPSSPIDTTVATATRNPTDLEYVATGNASPSGSVVVSVLAGVNAFNGRQLLTVGTSSNDMLTFTPGGSGIPVWGGTAGGVAQWNITGATSLLSSNPVLHVVRGTWITDNFHYYFDGVEEGTPDVSGTVVTFGNGIFVGEREVRNLQPETALITKLIIYPLPIPGAVGAP